MLTIGKLGTSRGRLEYYDSQVAAGLEDYYAGRGESPGRWRGTGARALGLMGRGRVQRSEFLALMRGNNPSDGSVLRLMGARSTVSGLDLTFSAPKSVSVLFAIDDEHVAAELLCSHERAVDVALGYLEREACWTRRGRDGVDRVRGEGFVAASYRHRMSRAGDPQLHTHVVVANLTQADGRYTALDARSIYEHKSAAGAVYGAVLRGEVRERLPWLSWRASGRGLFELDGVSSEVLRHFSQRRVEIEQRAAELVGVGAVGQLSRERMQGITLTTRKAKSYGVDGATWREESQARAAEHGLDHAALTALRDRAPTEIPELDVGALMLRLSGPDGLTGCHNTFARRHALAEIAGAFPQGADIAGLEDATGQYLADQTVAALIQDGTTEPRYTTHDLLAREREIVDGAQRRSTEGIGFLNSELLDRVLADRSPALNADQTAAVRSLTTSGRGIEAVGALAGTGKTTMIAALAQAYREAGWTVIGTAPTARAARQLRDTAQIKAETMHSLLHRLRGGGGLDPRSVLVIDEASMAPTRRTAQLLAFADEAGAKVIAVGDPGQLGPVEAGGWLATLARRHQVPALRQVMRQRDPAEQSALAALHDGDPGPYLADRQDTISVHETELGALLKLIELWHEAQRKHGQRAAVMIARDNLTRERLNQAARARLKYDGFLTKRGLIIGGREYAPGDRVIARLNDRRRDIDNGSFATIVAIDEDNGSAIVETDAGEPRALDAGYVAQHLEHGYALTAHGAQGATVSWAGVVGRPQEFTREWAYTALSRAREQTTVHLISQRSEGERERDEYAPYEPDPSRAETMDALRRAMKRAEVEPLAGEQALTPLTNPAVAHVPRPNVPRPIEPNGLQLLRRGRLQRHGPSARL